MSDEVTSGGQEAPGTRSRMSRPLTEDEVNELIGDNFIAVLATVGGEQPYAIPFIYGYEDRAFYAVMSPGRKIRNIMDNPNVCVTIVQTWDKGKRWRSVVATGKAGWVEGMINMAKALNVIRKQYPGVPVRSGAGIASLKGFHVMRVDVEELTGRGHD